MPWNDNAGGGGPWGSGGGGRFAADAVQVAQDPERLPGRGGAGGAAAGGPGPGARGGGWGPPGGARGGFALGAKSKTLSFPG
jgi:modulator of FtsH protease HflK